VTGRCEKNDLAKIKPDAECIPTARRSPIGNPGETFLSAEITRRLFFIFFTSSRRDVTETVSYLGNSFSYFGYDSVSAVTFSNPMSAAVVVPLRVTARLSPHSLIVLGGAAIHNKYVL
jgi:hypothetical protein